jgi:pyruvate dehydrogenase E2 component (dihydrolipoamide acetyltransferase)
MPLIDVKVPNIGDFDNVPVVEIQVKVGDEVKVDDPLITLESDKAAMDVPSPEQGKVAEVLVGVGDKVSEGSAIIRLDVSSAGKGTSQSKVDSDGGEASAEASAERPANVAAATTAAPPLDPAPP